MKELKTEWLKLKIKAHFFKGMLIGFFIVFLISFFISHFFHIKYAMIGFILTSAMGIIAMIICLIYICFKLIKLGDKIIKEQDIN